MRAPGRFAVPAALRGVSACAIDLQMNKSVDIKPARPGVNGKPAKLLQKDQAYWAIKQLMLDEDDAQMIFSERYLAGELDMGLASIRSALERLRSEGIVETIPKAGVRLPQITYREVMEFFEMRLVIEPHIAQGLAGRLGPAECDELAVLIADQKQAARERDTVAYHRFDLAFHECLARLYGNREMMRALGQMRDKMYRLSRLIHTTHPDRLTTNAEQHERVVDAICSGRHSDAKEAMELHLKWGRDVNVSPTGRFA